MSNDGKIDVQELIERTTDEGVGGSDLMKALEDISYDIAPSDKMYDGEDSQGRAVIRYETQEVYDILSA